MEPAETVERLLAEYDGACALSRSAAVGRDLDDTGERRGTGRPVSLR